VRYAHAADVRTAHRTGARGYAVQSEPRRVESNPSGFVAGLPSGAAASEQPYGAT
jgi:hypothetical protein